MRLSRTTITLGTVAAALAIVAGVQYIPGSAAQRTPRSAVNYAASYAEPLRPLRCEIRIEREEETQPRLLLIDTDRDGMTVEQVLRYTGPPFSSFRTGLEAYLTRPGQKRTQGITVTDSRKCDEKCTRDMTSVEQERFDALYRSCLSIQDL